jgi:hypothetical protein
MSVTVTSSKRLTQLRSEDAIVSGVVTAASFTGALTGNASTATKLSSARSFTLTGDVTGTVSSDLTSGASIVTTVANDSHTHDDRYYTESESDGRFVNSTGDTMTGDLLISSVSPRLTLHDTDTAGSDSDIIFSNGAGQTARIKHQIADASLPGSGQGILIQDTTGSHTMRLIAGGEIYANGGTTDNVSGANKVYHTGDFANNSSNWNTAYGWGNHASASYATQSYVGTQISNLVDSSPEALNTLNELAAALGDDANFSTTVTNSIATKAPLASPSFTGDINSSDTININKSSADTYSTGFNVRKRGTTGDATAAVTSGTELGYHGFYGWDGTASSRGAYAISNATQNWTSSARGTSYGIAVTANGTTANSLAFKIDQDKTATFYGSVKLNNLTASQTLETDASKNVISVAKQTGYNLALSTTATDIKINGTQSLGSLSTLARADHVHPVYAKKTSISRAINTAEGWVKIWRNTTQGGTRATDFKITGGYNNCLNLIEFRTVTAFYGFNHSIVTKSIGNYNGGNVLQIRTNYIAYTGIEVWVKLDAVNATQPGTITFEASDTLLVDTPIVEVEPTWDSRSVYIDPKFQIGSVPVHITCPIIAPKIMAGNSAGLALYEDGGQGIFIKDGGDVGIGTTSPSAPLMFGKSVYANPNSEDFYRIKFQDQGGITNDVGIGQSGTGHFDINFDPVQEFTIWAGTNNERLKIMGSTGNVGIGTTSPAQKLDVVGNIAASGSISATVLKNATMDSSLTGTGSIMMHPAFNGLGYLIDRGAATITCQIDGQPFILTSSEQKALVDGSYGTSVRFQQLYTPAYNASVTYQIGERVVYNNIIYYCIVSSLGNLPTNTTYWIRPENLAGATYTQLYTTYAQLSFTSATTIVLTIDFGATSHGYECGIGVIFRTDSQYSGGIKIETFNTSWLVLTGGNITDNTFQQRWVYNAGANTTFTKIKYTFTDVNSSSWFAITQLVASGVTFGNFEQVALVKGGGTMYGSVKLNNLTASQTLELDASKNIISAAKQTGYNLALSTTATDIKVNGTQSLGSLSTLARADHVHPTDTSRAPTVSPTFTGTVVLPSGQALGGPEIVDFAAFIGSTSGATKLAATAVAGSTVLTLPAATDILVGRNTADTLTNKILTAPRISSIVNTGTLTLPTSTDTLVGRNTIDTLTNKTLNAPTITGAGAIAGVFTGNITGNVIGNATSATTALTATTAQSAASITATANNTTNETTYLTFVDGATGAQGIETDTDLTYNPSTNVLTAGTFAGALSGNADTVTTNADLTGPVTSEGNITAIANGAITTAMQKHLQIFEFNGYTASAASTNYFIPSSILENKGPFNHTVDAGSNGFTALAPSVFIRTGGKVMPYTGTCKLWKGWVSASGSGAVNISIFKFTPVAGVGSNVALVLVKNFSTTALTNPQLIAINVDDITVGFDAGDILITGISCVSGQQVYFTSTLEVEWD